MGESGSLTCIFGGLLGNLLGIAGPLVVSCDADPLSLILHRGILQCFQLFSLFSVFSVSPSFLGTEMIIVLQKLIVIVKN